VPEPSPPPPRGPPLTGEITATFTAGRVSAYGDAQRSDLTQRMAIAAYGDANKTHQVRLSESNEYMLVTVSVAAAIATDDYLDMLASVTDAPPSP